MYFSGGILYFLKIFFRLILPSFIKTISVIITKAKINGAQLSNGSGENCSICIFSIFIIG